MPLAPDAILESPALLRIAPLILAAWDDAFLTPAELLAIREALERSGELDDAARAALHTWLDPDAPPTASALRSLARSVAQPRAAAQPAKSSQALLDLERILELPPHAFVPPRAAAAAISGRKQAANASDVARWRAALDGPQHAIRDAVRKLLTEDARFRVLHDPEMQAYREQVLAWCRVFGDQPWLVQSLTQPGGTEIATFVAAFETIACFDLSLVVKFGVQFGLFAGAIQNLGTARHHALLPDAARCELMGCFAMTERAHGSDVRSLQTVARYEPESREFVIRSPSLSAGKEWIGNAALHARSAVVFAQLETLGEQYGVHAWLVPIRDQRGQLLPGVRAEDCGHKMGLNGVDNGRLWFDDVRVPREALLDRFGQVEADGSYHSQIPSPGKRFFTMLGTLVGGRINVAVGALGAAKVGLTIALRYAEHRRQFPDSQGVEQRLIDYLSHRQRLLPALARAYAFSFAQQGLLARIAEAKADPEVGREIGTLAAGIKAIGTWQAIQTLQECRECCGGQGYLSANRIDALRTGADVFATFEGDNTVLLQLVAKDLLRLYARNFEDGPLRARLRELAGGVKAALIEHNPLVARRTDSDAIESPEFHLSALQFRERTLVAALARRIKHRVDDGMPPQAAFEACQDHALALGRAYVDRFVLERFQQAVSGDASLRPLVTLYGLECLASDLRWFLENDYIAANKSRAIRKQLTALVNELAPHARALTDAFGIPATCLGPLADPEYLASSGLAPANSEARPDSSSSSTDRADSTR
jgi:acyl-CoA oxidase